MHWSLQRSTITRTCCLIYFAFLIQLPISNRSWGLIVCKYRGLQQRWPDRVVIVTGSLNLIGFPSRDVGGTTNNICFMTERLSRYEVLWKLKRGPDRVSFKGHENGFLFLFLLDIERTQHIWCISKVIDGAQHHKEITRTVKWEWNV